ncbi:hypothetical protein C5167_031496 [Papaver somniferum]|uniref:ubiquitinyl hydrolase 1 n=1 Tax=Papaver somniferum TaxID=3469 RepID=A0A4Y7K7P4_PAPSO|nr:hypothetical protein C5167_031496 [Papaver somniferum]
MGITHVPEEIDKLVHLRYLDLSRNEDLIELPDSMSGLLNLQTLKLKECSNLFKFPKEIGRMIKLRNYSGCMFPSRMGNVRALTNLRFLKFDRCNKCDELPALGLLPSHEELVIKDLKNLKRIGVEIYGGGQCVTEVAFPKLITLEILENENLELWEFGNGEVQVHEMMPRVRSIKLTFCENLIALPALGLLPSLEELVIYELKNLKRIGVEIYGGGQCLGDVAFPKLKTLEFFYTVNLEVWEFGNGEVQVRQMMPRVTTIKLSGCKKLIALPDLNKLPSLETLKIEFAFKLTSIGCNTISSNGGTSFPELTTLEVSYMDNLEVIVRGADALIEGEQGDTNIDTAIMPRLVDLTLIECPKFPLPRYLPSLRSLYLYEHQGDDYFVVRLGEVVRYKELERLRLNAGIGNSWKLIPEYAKDLRQLEHLDIINSNCVGYYGRGDWSVLSHVPDIQIHFQNIDPLTYSPPQGIHPQPAKLYYLTGVPPEKLMITYKDALVKDYDDWWSLYLWVEEGGVHGITVDEIVKAPEKGPVFMEDLPEEQQAIAVGHTAGMYNLHGNTCYMNSTLQCLHSVPELKPELIKYHEKTNNLDQSSHFLTIATMDLFCELDRNVKPVSPKQFWMDADECWTKITFTLSRSLRASYGSENPEVVKKLFGIDLISRYFNIYQIILSSIVKKVGKKAQRQSQNTCLNPYLTCSESSARGIKALSGNRIEKGFTFLGAQFYLSERITHQQFTKARFTFSKRSRYMTVQFVRFFWNRESNQKEMNLQKVDYPLELDVYELCSDELRKKLEAPRKFSGDEEGRKAGSKIDEKEPKETDVKMLDAEGSSSKKGETSASSCHQGSTSKGEGQLTGVYELVSVLTHKGRSADLGHYVAWVKQESGMWIQFDDEEAILRCEEDITNLSGGCDWHTAYICMYKARVIHN